MDRFARLFDELDSTTRTQEKVSALVRYFREAPPEDAAWAVFLLTGRRLPRTIKTPQLRQWAAEEAELPAWLLEECFHAVGDQSETLALVLPEPTDVQSPGLAQLIEERIKPLRKLHPEQQREHIRQTWRQLTSRQRFLFHKMMGGSLRVGVAKALVIRALSLVAGVPPTLMAYRLMGECQPTPEYYRQLVAAETPEGAVAVDISKPYPFTLAYALEGPAESLGAIDAWQIEWKWDGVRAQLIRRRDEILIWSRGEELITGGFPEIVRAADVGLPEGTVLDGEILAWSGAGPLPFSHLQRRLGRKKVTPRVVQEMPVVFLAYDLLEWQGRDVRLLSLGERRQLLEAWHAQQPSERLKLSTLVGVENWQAAQRMHGESRTRRVEGLMLKRKDSSYATGRVRGEWWKWKVDPYHLDAVLIAAQPGAGKRASLYTDYTFGIWKGEQLVPVAKAYSGLTDEEIREVDQFVRGNTLQRFGAVCYVKPELVFELAFEGLQASPRHKAGVALRFPRMSRWRKDKPPREADTLETVQALLKSVS